jgi:hypothetical protein
MDDETTAPEKPRHQIEDLPIVIDHQYAVRRLLSR